MGFFSGMLRFADREFNHIVSEVATLASDVEKTSAPRTPPANSCEAQVQQVTASSKRAFTAMSTNSPVMACPDNATSPPRETEPAQTAAANMSVSSKGLDFIYNHEAQAGVSDKLYWPGGGSGVTLGPGYDMGKRSAVSVQNELTKIGVAPDVAKKIAAGAGLSGKAAEDFVKHNGNIIGLTDSQQRALLADLLHHYENVVRSSVKVAVNQNQFDALVSLVYNIGPGNFETDDPVLDYLNQRDDQKAAGSFWIFRRSGGVINQTLVERRKAEALMFNDGAPVDNIPWRDQKGVVHAPDDQVLSSLHLP